jgi:hypothetical protein
MTIMNKNQFKIATKGMMNSVRVIDGVTIANVGWLSRPWMIIETGETFDEASARDFNPIDSFVRGDDLYAAIYPKK